MSPSRAARLFLAASLLVACSRRDGGPHGSGNLKTETRSVSGFTRIALDGTGQVTIQQTGTESLSIEADDNLLPLLTSDVAGGKLTLATKGSIHPTKPIHYRITVKDIAAIALEGAGDVSATGLHADALAVRISGSGNVSLAGTAASETIDIDGAGRCDAAQLATKTARVTVDGAGHVEVAPSDTLDAKVDGVGDVFYTGNPSNLTQKVSGLGKVARR
jgi:hypothetical protein